MMEPDKLPKIAIVLCNLPSLGGVANHVINLAKYLDKSRFSVSIVYFSHDSSIRLEQYFRAEDQVKIHFVPQLWSPRLLFIPAVLYLAFYFKKNDISLVYSVFAYTDIVSTVAARLSGVRAIVASVRGRLVAENNPAWERLVYRLVYPLIAKLISRFIAVSEATALEAQEAFGLPKEKWSVVHNGLDLTKIKQRLNDQTERTEPSRIGVVSRLQYEKGINHFVASIPTVLEVHPDSRFMIAGHGPDGVALKQQAQQLGIQDQLEFLGWVSDQWSLISSLTILVLPSLREGMPWTVLEGMALGKPVVASAVGGVPEVVVDGETGILTRPGDENALANAIIWLLDNRERAAAMGQAGKDTVAKNFRLEVMVRRIEVIFEQTLADRKTLNRESQV